MIHSKSFSKWIKSKLFSESTQTLSRNAIEFDAAGEFKSLNVINNPNFLKISDTFSRKKAKVSDFLTDISMAILTLVCPEALKYKVSPVYDFQGVIRLQNLDRGKNDNRALLLFSNETKQNSADPSAPESDKLDHIKTLLLLSIKIERENNLLPLKFFGEVMCVACEFEKESYVALVKEDRTSNVRVSFEFSDE